MTAESKIYARVPAGLKQQVAAYAEDHGIPVSAAACALIEQGLKSEAAAPRDRRDPWVDRARLIEALHALRITAPSGYDRIPRIINGVFERTGGGE